jgi:glycosyltransferase involved in cell wall biosynthesis
MEINKLPLVSIIILSYKNEDSIIECIMSLVDQIYSRKEIIIVYDEGSLDGTKEIVTQLKMKFPEMLRIISTKHVGRSEARNIGWKNSSGQIFFFVDGDDAYKNDYVSKAVDTFLKDPKIGAVCLTGTSIKDKSTFISECTEIYSKIQQNIIQNGKFKPSWAWIYSRDAIEAVNGFDNNLNQAEDKDLLIRVKSAGYKVELITGINWFHRRTSNLNKYLNKTYLGGKRRIVFITKHQKSLELIKDLGFFFFFSTLIILTFVNMIFLILLLITMIFYIVRRILTVIPVRHEIQKKRYIVLYPLFGILTFFTSTIGMIHGILLLIADKLFGKKIDWSRV